MERGQRACRVVLLLLLLSSCSCSQVATAIQQVTAAPAECELEVVGAEGNPFVIKSARGLCRRGSMSVGMHPALSGSFQHTLRGIHNASCIRRGCLLTICGHSQVILQHTAIRGVSARALCVVGNANVTLTGDSIIGNNTSTKFVGAGVYAGENATLTITGNSLVLGNRVVNGTGGGVACGGNATLIIRGNSQIRGNRAINGAGGGVVCGDNTSVTITGNSIIVDNMVSSSSSRPSLGGGAAFGDNATVTITGESMISGNRAIKGVGGGVACVGQANVTMAGNASVRNNTITGQYGGGVVIVDNAAVVISGSSQIMANSALLGDGGGVACIGNSTVTISGSSLITQNRVVDGIGGGLLCGNDAKVVLTGHSVIGNNTSEQQDGLHTLAAVVGTRDDIGYGGGIAVTGSADVTIGGNSQITGNRAAKFGGGVVCDGNATVTVGGNGTFGSNINNGPSQGSFSGVSLMNNVYVMGDCALETLLYAAFSKCDAGVSLRRFPCSRGELVQGSACVCCPMQTYGFTPNSSACYQCPPHAICPGGDVIRPEAGYFHSSERSPQMIRCPLSTTACGEGACKQGYSGNLCGSCAAGFGTTTPLKCGACMRPQVQFGLYVLISSITVCYIAFTVHTTWKDNLQGCSTLQSIDIIKVLVQHLQYLVIIGSVSAAGWPVFLARLFAASSVVFGAASGQALSLDCWLSHYGAGTSLPLSIQRQLVYFAAPLVVFVVVVVFTACYRGAWYGCLLLLRRKLPGQPVWASVVERLPLTALVVAYCAYPTLVKASLAFFACVPIDDVNKQPYVEYAVLNHTAGYWVQDISQACFTGWHTQWALSLGVLGVLSFCLAAPLMLGVGLWVKRAVADEPDFRAHFGFLYRNFHRSKLWWEAVWLVQTVLLTAISVFQFSLQMTDAVLLLTVTLLASITLQLVFKPYAILELHHIHTLSAACLAFSTLGGLAIFRLDQDVTTPTHHAHVAIGVLVLAGNVGFVGMCLYLIIACKFRKPSSRPPLWQKLASMLHGCWHSQGRRRRR